MTPITLENWKEFNEWCDAEDRKVYDGFIKTNMKAEHTRKVLEEMRSWHQRVYPRDVNLSTLKIQLCNLAQAIAADLEAGEEDRPEKEECGCTEYTNCHRDAQARLSLYLGRNVTILAPK